MVTDAAGAAAGADRRHLRRAAGAARAMLRSSPPAKGETRERHGLLMLATTFPDRAGAETVARKLVAAGLAVCAQVGADLVSFYRWQGEVRRDTEVALC